MWATEAGDSYILFRLQERDVLIRTNSNGKDAPVKLDKVLNSGHLRERIYVAKTGEIFIGEHEYINARYISLIRLNKKGELQRTLRFALPKGCHCFDTSPLGVDKFGSTYMRISMDQDDMGKTKSVYLIVKIEPTGALKTVGSMPMISRAHMRSLKYEIGPAGELYCLYPLQPRAPKGAEVKLAIGQLTRPRTSKE